MRCFSLLIFIVILGVFSLSAAAAEQSFITTSIAKSFKALDYPYKNVGVKIVIKNELSEEDFSEQTILTTRNIHKKFLKAFNARGWQGADPLQDYIDAGQINIRQEKRFKNTLIKSFLYMCDSDPMANVRIYYGDGLDQYLKEIIDDAENCMIYKNRFKPD